MGGSISCRKMFRSIPKAWRNQTIAASGFLHRRARDDCRYSADDARREPVQDVFSKVAFDRSRMSVTSSRLIRRQIMEERHQLNSCPRCSFSGKITERVVPFFGSLFRCPGCRAPLRLLHSTSVLRILQFVNVVVALALTLSGDFESSRACCLLITIFALFTVTGAPTRFVSTGTLQFSLVTLFLIVVDISMIVASVIENVLMPLVGFSLILMLVAFVVSTRDAVRRDENM
jgi:hypothetical protein